jgi:hypothetical protein
VGEVVDSGRIAAGICENAAEIDGNPVTGSRKNCRAIPPCSDAFIEDSNSQLRMG